MQDRQSRGLQSPIKWQLLLLHRARPGERLRVQRNTRNTLFPISLSPIASSRSRNTAHPVNLRLRAGCSGWGQAQQLDAHGISTVRKLHIHIQYHTVRRECSGIGTVPPDSPRQILPENQLYSRHTYTGRPGQSRVSRDRPVPLSISTALTEGACDAALLLERYNASTQHSISVVNVQIDCRPTSSFMLLVLLVLLIPTERANGSGRIRG